MTSTDTGAAGSGADSETAPPPSLWRNSDYVGWWVGNTASALGTSISAISFPLLILYTTGSVAKAGTLTAAGLVSALVTTLWGGALADRVSRKAILVIAPLVQGAALAAVAALVAADRPQLPLLVAAATVSGLAAGVASGATAPALRRIARKDQLATATAQELGRDLGAQLLGGPVGGLLFSLARWCPFGIDALSFGAASLGAALIHRPLGPEREDRVENERTTVRQDIAAGFRFVRREPFLRFVVMWGALLNTLGQAFALLFIALVKFRGGGPTTIGLVSAVALVGGVVGSAIGPAVARSVRAKTVIRTAAWAFAGALVLVAVVPAPWEIGAVTFVAMLTMVPLNVMLQSYMVRLVPDEFSGRVSAVNRFGVQALEWTGPLLAGLLVALFGVPGGAVALLVGLVPLALALHLTRSLAVLDTPLDELSELRPAHEAG
ncbi:MULTISPECIES: MFS transporter [unclassified Streptomyces]|uniref:MFS transporter n=1 Tax=unclassified Streptomyces TaxID=2593676 RepID=UPI00068E75A5|nr:MULTISPECIES: MFS transporter [unclassified Streptomyces]MCH0560317.1 MFS transporter [Streptomyces sp. MUM 16J]